MERRRRRFELPSYLRLKTKFDIRKLQEGLENLPTGLMNSDDLRGESSYGERVGGRSQVLQKAFGLEFTTFEDAYKFLENNKLPASEMKNYLPDNKRMGWDFRNYVSTVDRGIYETEGGRFKVNGLPYKQIALTEFNPDEVNRVYPVKIPKSRLDERHYNKLRNWVKGTYFEEVIQAFKGRVHRARIAIMDPGAFISDHIDYNTDYSVRYHIPITTNKECGFGVTGVNGQKEFIKMPADGSAWFLNQGLKHGAWNRGQTQRAHLILSVDGQEDIEGLWP